MLAARPGWIDILRSNSLKDLQINSCSHLYAQSGNQGKTRKKPSDAPSIAHIWENFGRRENGANLWSEYQWLVNVLAVFDPHSTRSILRTLFGQHMPSFRIFSNYSAYNWVNPREMLTVHDSTVRHFYAFFPSVLCPHSCQNLFRRVYEHQHEMTLFQMRHTESRFQSFLYVSEGCFMCCVPRHFW